MYLFYSLVFYCVALLFRTATFSISGTLFLFQCIFISSSSIVYITRIKKKFCFTLVSESNGEIANFRVSD